MAITLGELKGKILRLLNKSPSNPGFYTDAKLLDAIEEAMDFIAEEMMDADEGWQKKEWNFDTEDGQMSIDIPEDLAMLAQVFYKIGDTYLEMTYRTQQPVLSSEDSVARQDGVSYQIIGNAFYFNPALSEGNTDGIKVLGMAFPQRMIDDGDYLEAHFNKAMQHYIRYKAASILAAGLEKFSISWADQEAQWYAKVQRMIVKRNQQSTAIGSFEP